MFEGVFAWGHVPPDSMDFVSSPRTISGHDDRSLEISCCLLFITFKIIKSIHNNTEAVFDGQELRDVVDD